MTTAERKRPTIRDVAEIAGVSRGTVSRMLTGGKWVSAEAAAAIAAAIEETGYRVNPHARSLVTRRANSIAFLLTEPQHLLFADPNFAILLRGATQALAERRISLVLMIAGSAAERAQASEFITGGHVDGVLVFASHSGNPIVASLAKSGIPTIAVGRPLGFETKVGYVAVDEVGAARTMTEYLRESGRSTIAHISGPLDTPGGIGRLEGYKVALGDAFDERLVAHGDYGRESGIRAMEDLLTRVPTIDAVFAANDVMAAAALTVLQGVNRRVPEDVAVAGFDDSAFATSVTPPLTTMRQPFERISAELVRLLLSVIDGGQPATITLPATLIKRSSA